VPYLKDIPEKFIPDLSGSPVLEIGKVDIIPQYAVEIDI
jgi:Ni2+-binding GTPase involved in maturation of urease and hydrogenase